MLTQDYPVTVVCEMLDCARSSYYHRVAERTDEAKLKADIKAVAAEWPTYGYRRITAQLQRQDWLVNRKRVQRLMRLMDIQAKIKRKKRRTRLRISSRVLPEATLSCRQKSSFAW